MSIPCFTAEDSLGPTLQVYRTVASWQGPSARVTAVQGLADDQSDEVGDLDEADDGVDAVDDRADGVDGDDVVSGDDA